nr:phospholipase A2-like [Onthophagus taurus]
MKILIVFVIAAIRYSASFEIVWDNNVTLNELYQTEIDFGRTEMVRMPNWFLIFPGTKWCGAGNIAENYDDLGEFRDTDKCCRSHDSCSEYIGAHQTKYNLTNPSFYSRLSCDCDEEFHKCLLSVNSPVSTQVGILFFNVLSTKCFKKEYPIVNCKRYIYVPASKCVEYELDTTQEKRYQWFDIPPY